MKCFECGQPAHHRHHVVPRSLGGTKTVSLCEVCHSKIHGHDLTIQNLTSSALQAKKTRGERLGTTPLGFKTVDGVVTVDESEQVTVERARQLRSEGLTLRAIASRLTDEGHQTKRGGRWEAATVNLLLKPRYIESQVVCQP